MLLTMLLVWNQGAQEILVPPHMRMPVFGTVYKERLYGLFDSGDLGYCLHWVDLNKSGPGSKGDASPVRWFGAYDRFQIRCGRVWLSTGRPAEIKSMSLEELSLFCRKSSVSSWDAYLEKYGKERRDAGSIALPGLAKRPFDRPMLRHTLVGLVGLGIVPTSENTLKTFLLLPRKSDMEIWDTEARFDKKTMTWETIADEKNMEKIDSAFKEDFYAFHPQGYLLFRHRIGQAVLCPASQNGREKADHERPMGISRCADCRGDRGCRP
jgi:hypothetical protein